MKSLLITLSDDVHAKLAELKDAYSLANLNDTVAEAITREHRRKTKGGKP